MTKKKEWWARVEKTTTKRDPLLPHATSYLKALASVSGDRQPAEHEQDPEVERRRQQDLRKDIMLLRDVMGNIIKDLEDAGFLSEEFKEAFAGKEEDDPYQPCRNPRQWWELLLCTREWISKLYRCCLEHEGRWRFWTYRIQELQHNVYKEAEAARQRFTVLEEFEDQFPEIPDAKTWEGGGTKVIEQDYSTGSYIAVPEEDFMHVKSATPAKYWYYFCVTPPNDAPAGTLWLTNN